jgi:GDP-fucose transporter C1
MFTVGLIWVLGEVAAAKPNIAWLKEFPKQTVDWDVARLMVPVSASFVLMIVFNQLCLQFVEVSFYNVARSLSIVTNVILSYSILGQKTSVRTMLCLVIVIAGFFVGAGGEINLNVLGTVFGVIASVFVSLHSVYTKKSNGFVGGDKWKLAFYSNFIAAFMYPPLIVIAGEHIVVMQHVFMFARPFYWFTMLIGSFLGFLIGIVTVMQINFTSPLTHNISGMAKACVQTLLALIIYRNPTTVMAMVGVALVIGGSGLYTFVRMREDDAAKAAAKAEALKMAATNPPSSSTSSSSSSSSKIDATSPVRSALPSKSSPSPSYGSRVFLLSLTLTIASALIRDALWFPTNTSLHKGTIALVIVNTTSSVETSTGATTTNVSVSTVTGIANMTSFVGTAIETANTTNIYPSVSVSTVTGIARNMTSLETSTGATTTNNVSVSTVTGIANIVESSTGIATFTSVDGVTCSNRGTLTSNTPAMCRCIASYGSACQFCAAGYEATNSTSPCHGHFEAPLNPDSDLYNPTWGPKYTFHPSEIPASIRPHPELSNSNRSRHSARRMIGDDDSPNDGGWLRRTFYFKNICYQRSTLEWIYYRSPEERDSGFQPSSLTFAASSMSAPGWGQPQPVTPRIIDGPIPLDVHWEDNHAMYAIYQGWHAANFAHVLWDEFMPLYLMMYLFDVVTHDIQPLRMNTAPGHSWWDTMCHTEPGSRPKCRQFYAQMTYLLTPSAKIVDIEAFLGNAGDRHVCFPRMLAGIGTMSDHCLDVTVHGRRPGPHVCNEGRAKMLWEYRNWLLEAASGDPKLVPCQHNILVGSNSFKRAINNWDAVAQAVRDKFGLPARRIDWAQLSVDEQLQLASNTTLYLAMCGGSASPAMFMPRGATMIVWCNEYKLDWNLYNHMSHLRVIFFDVKNNMVDVKQALSATAEALTQWVPWRDASAECPPGSFARPGVWSDWGTCSQSCSGKRSRTCSIYDNGPSCVGAEIESCNTHC